MCTYVILVHILKKIGVPNYINWVIQDFVGGDNNVGRSVYTAFAAIKDTQFPLNKLVLWPQKTAP